MFVACPLNVDIHLFTTFSLILSLETGSAAVDIAAVPTIVHESNLKSQRGPVTVGQVTPWYPKMG